MLTFYPFKQKKEKNDKASYRPVSTLPNLCKIYKKLISNQINDNFDSVASPTQCGCCKGHSRQHCIIANAGEFQTKHLELNSLTFLNHLIV